MKILSLLAAILSSVFSFVQTLRTFQNSRQSLHVKCNSLIPARANRTGQTTSNVSSRRTLTNPQYSPSQYISRCLFVCSHCIPLLEYHWGAFRGTLAERVPPNRLCKLTCRPPQRHNSPCISRRSLWLGVQLNITHGVGE